MHPALEIAELRGLIYDELKLSWDPGDYTAICSLTRVCRSFSELALDDLWSTQDTLIHILACMPDDLWEVVTPAHMSPYMVPRRAIEPEDWKRFSFYARRIKAFSIHDFTGRSNDSVWRPALQMLAASLPADQMFPNLRVFKYGPQKLRWFPYLHIFLGPRLESISLGVLSTLAHLPLLSTLPTRCPLLESVTVVASPDLPLNLLSQAYSTMIQGLTRLKRLDVGTMNQIAFEHLALLPTLQSLKIHGVQVLAPSAPPAPYSFLNLRELDFRRVSPQFLSRFIAVNDAWSLISLGANMTSALTLTQTANLFTLFAERCDATRLARLAIDADTRPDPRSRAIPFDTLRSLFCFAHLCHIRLQFNFDLDDVAIETLAQAWPRVQNLALDAGALYCRPPSQVTLRGLRSLARYCRDLRRLSMRFDASNVPPDNPPPESEIGVRMFCFRVEDSVLIQPVTVAAYLFATFPNVRDMRPADMQFNEDDGDVDDLRARVSWLQDLWKDVMRLHWEASEARAALANA
ncbi:hypothetical protein DFH06DRAFT_1471136 [Mycena polygramma]|nr:hypothetical protein DFH06DRAFT_1471136 [Mycena polygramma]